MRVGNAAHCLVQHDEWDELVDSVYLHSKEADHLDGQIWRSSFAPIRHALAPGLVASCSGASGCHWA